MFMCCIFSRAKREKVLKESKVMKIIDSPYVIKYYDSFEENKQLYILMEYAPNGSLRDFINVFYLNF